MQNPNQKSFQKKTYFNNSDQPPGQLSHPNRPTAQSHRPRTPQSSSLPEGQDLLQDLGPPQPGGKLIYLSCLSLGLSLDQVYEVFKKFGQITKIEAFTPFITKSVNQIVVIAFKSPNVVKWLADKLEKIQIGNNKLKLNSAESTDAIFNEIEHLRLTRVYVNYLPPGMTSRDLEELFSQFGKVEKVYIVKKNKKPKNSYKSKRNGTIIFEEEDTVKKLPEQGVEYQGLRLVWKSYYFNFGGQPGNRRHYVMRKEQYNHEIFYPSKSPPGRQELHPRQNTLTRSHKRFSEVTYPQGRKRAKISQK